MRPGVPRFQLGKPQRMTQPQDSTDQPEAPGAAADARLHDMGGDTGPTPPGSRGGGGLGPQEVREADEHARAAGDGTA